MDRGGQKSGGGRGGPHPGLSLPAPAVSLGGRSVQPGGVIGCLDPHRSGADDSGRDPRADGTGPPFAGQQLGEASSGPGKPLLDRILDERSREPLSGEHRRHRLPRPGKWSERTHKYDRIITPGETVLPSPQAVIDANLTRTIEQSPGY